MVGAKVAGDEGVADGARRGASQVLGRPASPPRTWGVNHAATSSGWQVALRTALHTDYLGQSTRVQSTSMQGSSTAVPAVNSQYSGGRHGTVGLEPSRRSSDDTMTGLGGLNSSAYGASSSSSGATWERADTMTGALGATPSGVAADTRTPRR